VSQALPKRTLGRTSLEVCTLGFGGAGIGNLYRPLCDDEAAGAVQASFAAGVRYFDTAPFYGFGLSEQRLGAVLGGEAAPVVLSTKVGRRLVPTGPQDANVGREGYFSPRPFAPVFDYSYDAVMRSHEESLQRLGVSRVDILLCHDIGRLTHGAQHESRLREFLDGGYPALLEIRESGAVRAIGLGVNESEVCLELLQRCEFDCLLLAGRYTLLEQKPLDELLPLCEARGISILSGGPFNSGILAAGSRNSGRSHYNYAPPPAEVVDKVRALEAACDEFSVPLQAAALQFPLGHPAVASVVAGCATAAESRNAVAMFTTRIPAAFWMALRDRELIDPRAPLPLT
jgi:D-threo-aldose 1-dehydrogenase